MRRLFLTLLIAILTFSALPARAGNIDSVRRALAKARTPAEQVTPLTELCFFYSDNCMDSVVPAAYRLMHLAEQEGKLYNVVQAHYFLAKNFKLHQQYDSARAHLAIGFAKSEGNNMVRTNSWISYFDFYNEMGLSDSALYCLFRAQDVAEASRDLHLQAGVLHRIGNFYFTQKAFGKALEYCIQSLKIWEKVDPDNTAGVLSDIGNIYYNQGNYKEALGYYQRSFKVSQKNNNILGYGYSLNNIGLVYSKMGNHTKALEYFQKSLSYYQKTRNNEGIANILTNLGKEQLRQGKYTEALDYGRQALELAMPLQLKPLILDAYTIMADGYEQAGDYKMANECRKQEVSYTDSILNVTMVHKVADMQTKYLVSRKEAENHALKAQKAEQMLTIQRQRFLTVLIGVILALVLLLAVSYRNVSRERKERLKTLEAQNTLIESKNIELALLNETMSIQKKALEENNEFKNRLFSIVSHDVRSPLSSLQSLLIFMSEGDDIPHDMLVSMLKDLADKVQQTSSFLENLLSWAKSQLEGYRPDLGDLELNHEVDAIFGLYRQQLSSKHIQAENNIPRHIEVTTDANLLRMVLRNLISNAVKFTPENGQVTVSAELTQEDVIVSVKDTGIGIVREASEKLFMGKGYTTLGTNNEKGTGLGLTLCKDFIERLGGRIWVESELGKGSTFLFSLPLDDVHIPANAHLATASYK